MVNIWRVFCVFSRTSHSWSCFQWSLSCQVGRPACLRLWTTSCRSSGRWMLCCCPHFSVSKILSLHTAFACVSVNDWAFAVVTVWAFNEQVGICEVVTDVSCISSRAENADVQSIFCRWPDMIAPYLHLLQNYTVSQKNETLYSCPQFRQILTDFQNSFTVRLSKKLAIKKPLKIPPHWRWKYLENRSIFGEAMDKSIVSRFFWLTVYNCRHMTYFSAVPL